MYLLAGLGNPGRPYQSTRHNLGFLVLQSLAGFHHIPLTRKKFHSLYGQGEIEGRRVLLVLPQTYMNLSGEAVGSFVRYARIAMDHVLVVHDDLDLEWGRIRLVARGGAAGHKGVLSVMEHLQTDAFPRLRIGIGRPAEGQSAEAFVLEPIPRKLHSELAELIDKSLSAIQYLLQEGVEKAMAVFNARRREGPTA